jgi:hypothetical protein
MLMAERLLRRCKAFCPLCTTGRVVQVCGVSCHPHHRRHPQTSQWSTGRPPLQCKADASTISLFTECGMWTALAQPLLLAQETGVCTCHTKALAANTLT